MVRRVFVVLMLSSVSLLLAPVASTTAAGGTAQNVHGFFAIDAAGPTELQIWRYALDDVAPNDGMVCDVTMAKGTGVPAADMPPIVTGACNFDHTVNLVSNLEPNTAYTFAARTRYPDGSVSEPTVRTAMTRTVGVYLTDNNRAGHIWRTTARRTGQIDNEALTVGRYGGAYVVFAQRDPAWNTTVYFTSRSPGGAWTPAVKLGVTDLELSVFVARAPSGQLVAGWTAPASVGAPGGPAYRVRPAGSSRWGPVRRVAPGTRACQSGAGHPRSGSHADH